MKDWLVKFFLMRPYGCLLVVLVIVAALAFTVGGLVL